MRYCIIHVRVKSEFARNSDNMAWFSKRIAKNAIRKVMYLLCVHSLNCNIFRKTLVCSAERTDCVQSDVRAFDLAVDCEATALETEV